MTFSNYDTGGYFDEMFVSGNTPRSGCALLAKKLASLVGDGKPASGEARALLEHASDIQGASAGKSLSPGALTALGAIQGDLLKVSQAFGIAK